MSTALAGCSFHHANLNGTESNGMQINSSAVDNESIIAAMLKLPLSFIENRGQASDETKYMVKTSEATIYFTPNEVLFALSSKNNSSLVRMSFEGDQPANWSAKSPLPG